MPASRRPANAYIQPAALPARTPRLKGRGETTMPLKPVSLDDKYDLGQSRVFVSGFQALVRLTLMQKERDRRAGLNTAGYVTGYRGSPLGTLDQQFMRAGSRLAKNDIVFHPATNEDLAATALSGSQQAELRGEGKYDGVFGMWYGKGPGVDRSGDAFKHANFFGTARHGGVLAFTGDDHSCKSSTLPNQSDFALIDAEMPALSPADIDELLEFGMKGFALSRFAGLWVGVKAVADTMDASATVSIDLNRYKTVEPDG